MIFVPDIIGEVVDSMRATGVFNVAIDNGDGTFTINVVNELKQFEWVEISGIDYKIIERTENDFKIESIAPIISPGIYKALSPYYLYGHILDINRRLLEKDQDEKFRYQKYPLIALKLPLTQEVNSTAVNSISANVAIFEFTEKNYTSEERYENVIKPILSPLYQDLLVSLKNSPYIGGLGILPHKRVDRLFWGVDSGGGKQNGNIEYIFNDPLDAIELIDLKLKILDFNCIKI